MHSGTSWMIRHKLGKRAHLSIQADWLCVRMSLILVLLNVLSH